jgi:limonene-1,2-epoxide hydrolase
MKASETLEEYIHFFNTLEQGLNNGTLQRLTHADMRFSDPFNDVQGHEQITAVLKHFVKQVKSPHFNVLHIAWDQQVCLLRWDFSGELPKFGQWSFPGVSEIHFNDEGLITLHQDHWDASQFFYQKLPIIGPVLRWIRKQAQPA